MLGHAPSRFWIACWGVITPVILTVRFLTLSVYEHTFKELTQQFKLATRSIDHFCFRFTLVRFFQSDCKYTFYHLLAYISILFVRLLHLIELVIETRRTPFYKLGSGMT